MKKINFTIVMFAFTAVVFGQNVGIGTATPNVSAALHIAGTNKGVLFPNVFLAATVDNNTVPTPAQNLIVFNTNPNMYGGKGLYYNSGSAASASWAKVGDLSLPYSSGTSTPSYAFSIQNYSANTASIGIQGFSQNGYGLYGSSAAGTGIYATSTTGNAIEISGKIKIAGTGQLPATGKVLTSDANGNATWEGAIAFSSTGIQPDGAREFSDNVEKKVPFYTEDYDYGNNYNPSSISPYSTFTAPVKGIYHFDVGVVWHNNSSYSDLANLYLKTSYNGVATYRTTTFSELTPFLAQYISRDLVLRAGEQVFVSAKQWSGTTLALEWGSLERQDFVGGVSCYFNGRLVMKL